MALNTRQILEETLAKIRSRVSDISSKTFTEQQRLSNPDPKIVREKDIWVVQQPFSPPPEQDVQEALSIVVKLLGKDDGVSHKLPIPTLETVRGEWVGHKPSSSISVPQVNMTDREKYGALIRDTKRPLTIFYVFGSQMIRNSPVAVRRLASKLAARTGGRVFSANYRLAPHNPFPAPILDLLVLYLSLLYPPPGSLHDAIPASSIVFAGDSSGFYLCQALVQVLLHLPVQGKSISDLTIGDGLPTLQFHGELVSVPLPAGVAGLSAANDHTLSLPSHYTNAKFDIFEVNAGILSNYNYRDFPPCPQWPTNPPRLNPYVSYDNLLYHPLVSVVLAKDWRGAPPMWIAIGEERFGDSNLITAKSMVEDGVSVRLDKYLCMPHSFPLFLPNLEQSEICITDWALACVNFVEGRSKIGARFREVTIDCKIIDRSITELTCLTIEDAKGYMQQNVEERRRRFDMEMTKSNL